MIAKADNPKQLFEKIEVTFISDLKRKPIHLNLIVTTVRINCGKLLQIGSAKIDK